MVREIVIYPLIFVELENNFNLVKFHSRFEMKISTKYKFYIQFQ